MAPQSFTSAAKQMAEYAGLRWAHVLKIYRALQERSLAGKSAPDGWLPPSGLLPYSSGRHVWAAHPNFMARLLVAVANTDEPSQARRMVETFIWATENGEGGPPGLQEKLVEFLTKPEFAASLERIDFYPDTGRVCFSYINEPEGVDAREWFWMGEVELRPDGTTNDIIREPTLIRHNGAIDGELFRLLCNNVRWTDDHPIVEAAADEGEE